MYENVKYLLLIMVISILFINPNMIYADSAKKYKENSPLSKFLNDQGFKFSNLPTDYIVIYKLKSQQTFFGKKIYWYNKSETVGSQDNDFIIHPIPIKEGSFVVYIPKTSVKHGITRDLRVWKFYSVIDGNISADDVERSFFNKYCLKNKDGQPLPNQFRALHIKHGTFYLQVIPRLRFAHEGGKGYVLLEVNDNTYVINQLLKSKEKAKSLF